MHYILDRLHFIILFFGILFSLIFGYILHQANLEKEDIRFNSQTKRIVQDISNRMDVYRGVLYSGLGLFEASNNVTREEWKIFVNKLQMKKYFPGIQGLGYSVVIKHDELKEHISTVRDQGYELYDIYPKDKRDIYTSIIYIEPFNKRNQRAFGYDMYSEKMRQKAMRRTIETGLPTLSDKVRLVQEDGHDEQAGFLLYSALYKKNMPLNTKQDRYKAIQGFVYAVFRAKDFLQGTLDTLDTLDLKMYAGNVKDESMLLFSTDTPEVNLNNDFKKDVNLEIDGNNWLFEITAKDSFIKGNEIEYPFIYIILGLFISFLITIILKRHSEVRPL
jgi:CHASE1-domain containing sensor protein